MFRGRRKWCVIGGAILILLALRIFVFELRRVDGLSMWPRFEGGDELILVRKTTELPKRLGLVVLEDPRDSANRVLKRYVAGPKEFVQVVDGDLLVGSAADDMGFVPRDLRDVLGMRVPEFRLDRERLVAVAGRHAVSDDRRFVEFDGRETPSRVRYPKARFTDRRPDRNRLDRRHEGEFTVRDVIVSVGLHERSERAQFVLTHRIDDATAFALTMSPRSGTTRVSLTVGGESVFADPNFGEHVVTVVAVDDVFALLVGDLDAATPRELWRGVRSPSRHPERSYVTIDVTDGSVILSHLEVARDVYWGASDSDGRRLKATREPLWLGPGHLFVLGDNGHDSLDGRQWGSVDVTRVVGRPVFVCWPPRRAGRIRDGR